jgi:hypothetical protein
MARVMVSVEVEVSEPSLHELKDLVAMVRVEACEMVENTFGTVFGEAYTVVGEVKVSVDGTAVE